MNCYFHLAKCRQQVAVGPLRCARWGHSGGGPGRGELRGQPGDERRLARAVGGLES